MDEEVLLTQEGFDKLEEQLEYLKTTQRTEIAERIKIALGYGDLSENSEYDEAKSAQEDNEGKIIELENKIRHAKIIDDSEIDTKTVQVGNTVEVLDMEFNKNVTYTNRIPIEIAEVFEKYGFIWGGKWYHFDTMHFEYRPELLIQ